MPRKFILLVLITLILFFLAACGVTGPESQTPPPDAPGPTNPGPGTTSSTVSAVSVSPASVVGGTSASGTVTLSSSAPSGTQITLTSSDPLSATVPASVVLASSQSTVTFPIATRAVVSNVTVNVTASYNNSSASGSLVVTPQTSTPPPQTPPSLTITGFVLSPATVVGGLTISGTVTLSAFASSSTTVSLSASDPSLALVPTTATALPGQSSVTFFVSTHAVTSPTTVTLTASLGGSTRNATLALTAQTAQPPSPPPTSGGTFTGCMYRENGHRYQGVLVSMPGGTYPIDANLYYGTTCDPARWTDEIGFNIPNPVSGTGMMYWFIHYWDQPETSAIWKIGNQTSVCIDYSKVPDCN